MPESRSCGNLICRVQLSDLSGRITWNLASLVYVRMPAVRMWRSRFRIHETCKPRNRKCESVAVNWPIAIIYSDASVQKAEKRAWRRNLKTKKKNLSLLPATYKRIHGPSNIKRGMIFQSMRKRWWRRHRYYKKHDLKETWKTATNSEM